MSIRFAKMHGLGNDFMVLDGINQDINLGATQIAALAQRHTGVGFDQCLLIERSQRADVDFNYRIFNADGQEVGQCGNGARCLALFVRHYGLTSKNKLTIATNTTEMDLIIHEDQSVRVDMGIPKLNPADIPFKSAVQTAEYSLELRTNSSSSERDPVTFHALSVGNPHAVLLVENIQSAPVEQLGQQISQHESFPQQVNVGFMQVIRADEINLRVYERGCGETQACGSGAVAAVAAGRLFHQLASSVLVHLPGGDLIVDWPNLQEAISLTGPAEFVYEGILLSS
jgi:diaminopimelate epimerase